jgi:protein subunit release factor B
MSLSKEKIDELNARMQHLGIHEDDLIEKFILGSGKGGQKINKTSSCVYLKHIPTSLEVKCSRDRSRAMNRFLARRELCDQLEKQILGEKSKKEQAFEKIRRQKRRRSRKQKEKMLAEKKIHSSKKQLRQKPSS